MAGIYIHVPFCHSKCPYCDFYSMPGHESAHAAFAGAVAGEWRLRRGEVDAPFTTLYFGGGTPSILPVGLLASIVDALPVADVEEFTIEVNPEDVTPQLVASLLKLGVNRVSMGVQSLDDGLLSTLRRRHSAAAAIRAMKLLRDGGIPNISLDLMYGLPGQTMGQWADTLDRMLEFRPDHLSAYILSYEPGTRFTAMLSQGRLPEQDEDLVGRMYARLCACTAACGYRHYEISNFALPGRESRHNSAYWNLTPYIGLGPGAHSFDGRNIRRANPWSLSGYVASIASGQPAYGVETEESDTLLNDLILTSLRTSRGLRVGSGSPDDDMAPDASASLLTPAERERILSLAAPFVADGRMTLTDGRLAISEQAWLTSDSLISALLKV